MKHFLIAILFASIAITIVLNKINKNKEGKASMQLNTFKLEDFYAQYEFKTTYMLSSSDAESWSLDEILQMANEEEKSLWNNQRFGYTETKGLPALRKAITTSYPNLTPENILCFAGAEDAIFCALLTICSSQDHAIVVTPCYQSLTEIPQFTGCSLTTIDLQEKNNWRIDIQAIKAAIRKNTKIVVINFPHNPTGQIITPDELHELIQLLDQHGIYLLSDEVYRLLGQKETTWAQPAASLYNKALSIGVMSKAFGLPGLRIGWIACQDQELLQKIEHTKHYTSLCNSGPAEIISLIALRNQATILQRNNEIIAHNMILLDVFFTKHADLFSWVRPQGGCTGFVQYHGTKPLHDFCYEVIEKAGILLLPGSVYSVSSPHFRIGFGRKNMPEVLAHLEKFLSSNK